MSEQIIDNLKVGETYWPATKYTKPFEVMRIDEAQSGVIRGYYLAYFNGSETEAVFVSSLKGKAWWDKNWAKTQTEAWRKELEAKKQEVITLEKILEKKNADQ